MSLFICAALGSYAQNNVTNHRMIKPNQIYAGGGYICNDSIYTLCDIQDKLINNPAAYKEYNKYASVKSSSTIFGVLCIAGLVGGITTLNSNNNLSGKLLLASIIPMYISIKISNRGQKHLTNAIAIYNIQY